MGYFQDIKLFLLHIFHNRQLLLTLIKNDFKKQYLGSYLGLFWAFAQPFTYIIVIWFVFTYGFRHVNTADGTPFFLWLIAGMIPWFFFASAFTGGTNAVVNHAYLVKKVAFRVSILPLVQIGSSFLIHIVLVVFLIVTVLLYGYTPSLYWLQLLYYLFMSIIFLLGLTWLFSALRVFIKDIGNFVNVVIQIGFWATPIFWNKTMLPLKYHFLLYINPMAYIVDGFRNTVIDHVWFWEKPMETFYFLSITLSIFIVGAIVFKRLRPHFGNVL